MVSYHLNQFFIEIIHFLAKGFMKAVALGFSVSIVGSGSFLCIINFSMGFRNPVSGLSRLVSIAI